MRNIKHIVLHCTATDPFASVESIKSYWRNVLKWRSPGYHYIIKANGDIVQLLDEDKISNGVAGHNSTSVHVSYIGGITKAGQPYDTRTPEQQVSMLKLVLDLQQRYPSADILGHRDFAGVAKACPSFDVKEWLKPVIINPPTP